MTRIWPPGSCRPVVNVLESLSLRIGYAKHMLVAATVSSRKKEKRVHIASENLAAAYAQSKAQKRSETAPRLESVHQGLQLNLGKSRKTALIHNHFCGSRHT